MKKTKLTSLLVAGTLLPTLTAGSTVAAHHAIVCDPVCTVADCALWATA